HYLLFSLPATPTSATYTLSLHDALPILAVRVQADYSRSGRLLRYSMVLIDTHNTAADNGRVLGYDNSHGYHHRHYLGKVEPVEFESYESTEKRFEAEVRQYLETHEPKPRT